ncbi:26S proteasome regulatory subunit N10 [Cryptococcus wingfieldii CBS 7118]|uniref:26S proteasome regulatory subunit N10 n=1 Tax=Cryptococcus wingfieldii CBS 7118 TaxID=1295528 RepID=A0A1E3IM96_9TREE|nr:26S proteasome regulatory subunit N10 [Cryptococcus wingfieldii CBS 7118]ODN89724.1 26S proteasome regulatory subunit N10 [Cryptococcus wingfieldii CBS 7118]
MPLESCMLILDNSEYMRNGDCPPTRFQAQAEAVQTLFTAKTDANPDPSLLVTPTNDLGRLLHALSKVLISSLPQLSTAISIASLALKHRENKNQRQRIVVFVASPLSETADELVKLGKRLRKNNVVVDVVTFGDEGRENDDKLRGLVDAVGSDESHLVSVPPGESFLSDVIASSPILFDGENAPAGGAAGAFGDDLDPSLDPELAMAIRMSLQEAEAQAAAAAPAESSSSGGAQLPPSITQPLSTSDDVQMAPGDASASAPAPAPADPKVQSALSGTGAASTGPALGGTAGGEQEEEDEELAAALRLSKGEDVEMGEGEEEEDEDAAIARAIAMSLEQGEKKQ